MGLKIVTGGTTGAQDGTLVSSGNKLTFAALNTPYTAHMRCDNGFWSADQTFTLPAELEVSFDGGSTWKGSGLNPIPAPEIEDVNYLLKFRQIAGAATAASTFDTNGSYTAITALGTVGSFTATPGNAQVALSWAAVTNRDHYQIDRATNSGFTTGVVTGVYTGTGTTYTDTGLTNGTTYYYRIKAIGIGRYSDSASYATANAAASAGYRVDDFTDTNNVALASHTPSGGTGAWTQVAASSPGSNPDIRVKSNRAVTSLSQADFPTTATVEYWLSGTSNNDCAAEADVYVESVTATGNAVTVCCRNTGASPGARNQYRVQLLDDGTLTLSKVVGGVYTPLGTYAVGTLTAGATYTIRVEAIGTAIKAYLNGVQRISVTDSAVTAGGGLALQVVQQGAVTTADAQTGLSVDAVRLLNT